MNIANKLTIIRIALIPVFIVLVFVKFPWHMSVATAVFCIACITDFLDGYIARKTHTVSALGKFLDPIADKMLCACALIAVSVLAIESPVIADEVSYKAFFICITVYTMVILCREIMISGFRIIAADKGVALAADIYGKIKTATQMVALILLLPVTDIFAVTGAAAELASQIIFYIGFGLLSFSMIMTVFSGIRYIVLNKAVLKDNKEVKK